MDPRNIKIVSEYREPKDNEFFFRENPFNHSGIYSVIDYLKFHFKDGNLTCYLQVFYYENICCKKRDG